MNQVFIDQEVYNSLTVIATELNMSVEEFIDRQLEKHVNILRTHKEEKELANNDDYWLSEEE